MVADLIYDLIYDLRRLLRSTVFGMWLMWSCRLAAVQQYRLQLITEPPWLRAGSIDKLLLVILAYLYPVPGYGYGLFQFQAVLVAAGSSQQVLVLLGLEAAPKKIKKTEQQVATRGSS
jgi:hypothetical protein